MNDILLAICVLLTSSLTATLGVGGGMLLIGIMPWFLPIQSVVPMHTIAQLASNLSRACFNISNVIWLLCKEYTLGAIIGVLVFGALFIYFPLQWISPLIGLYIIASLWWKNFSRLLKKLDSVWLIGALQTGLGLFVGATGPLSTSVLVRKLKDKDAIIATAAVFASLGCFLRLVFFIYIDFNFSAYIPLMIKISIAAIFGSYAGAFLRKRVPDERFVLILKVMLTLIALTMVFSIKLQP